MGLRLARAERATGRFGGLWRGGRWSLPAVLLACALLAEAVGAPAREALRYARTAVADGELWRLVTGHLVHLGWSHLLMNALALVAIWVLVGRSLRGAEWLFVAAVSVAGIDAGFWWLDERLEWYVGMSGLLHGLLAAGLLAGSRDRRGESLALGLLLVGKLAWEQLFGALPGSAEAAGGAVVVDAHLYGALGGAAAAVLLAIPDWLRPRTGDAAGRFEDRR